MRFIIGNVSFVGMLVVEVDNRKRRNGTVRIACHFRRAINACLISRKSPRHIPSGIWLYHKREEGYASYNA